MSQSESMVERVARALCCPSGVCGAPETRDHLRGNVGICQAHSYRKDARAAIEAMKMIDAALREG